VTHREVSTPLIIDRSARGVGPVAADTTGAGDGLVTAQRALTDDQRRAAFIRNAATNGEATIVAQTGAAKGLIVGKGTVANSEIAFQPLADLVDAVEDRAAPSCRATRPRAAEGLVVGEESVLDGGAAFIVQPAARSAEDRSPTGGIGTARCDVPDEG